MISNIVSDVFNSFIEFMHEMIVSALNFILSLLDLNVFSPSLNTFIGYVGEDNMNAIIKMFSSTGYFCAVALFAFSFFMMWISGLREFKDSLGTIFARIIIAIILITIIPNGLKFILEQGQYLYENQVVKTFGEVGKENVLYDNVSSEEEDASWLETLSGEVKEQIETSKDEEEGNVKKAIKALATFTLMGPIYEAFKTITASTSSAVSNTLKYSIDGILLLIVAYNILKLAIELIKRYFMICVMYITFPAICSTVATAETSGIFWTYLKSYVSQIIALIVTHVWVQLSIFFMKIFPPGIISTLALIAFISIGVRLDAFMKDHGFSIPSSGGALLDSFVRSGVALAGVTMVASRVSRGTGAILTNAAGAYGSTKLGAVGNILQGKSISSASILDSMTNSLGGQAAARRGGLSFTPGMAKELDGAFRLGGFKNKTAFTEAYNSLSAEGRKGYLAHVANQLNGDGKLSKALKLRNGESFQITGFDGQGRAVGTVMSELGQRDFTVGTNSSGANSVKFDDITGNDMFATYTGDSTLASKTISLASIFGDGDIPFENGRLAIHDSTLATIAQLDTEAIESAMSGIGDINADHFWVRLDDGALLHADGGGINDATPVLQTNAGGYNVYDCSAIPGSEHVFTDGDACKDFCNQHPDELAQYGILKVTDAKAIDVTIGDNSERIHAMEITGIGENGQIVDQYLVPAKTTERSRPIGGIASLRKARKGGPK